MTETLRFTKKHTLLLLAFFTVHSLFSQTIRYVNAGLTTGLNNGTNWANAYKDLQLALAAAQSGDQVWVANGTYYPTTSTTDRTISFVMKNNVGIYGGFTGTENALSQRDWKTNVTTLSGDIDRATDPLVVTGSGGTLSITGNIGNSHHVVRNNYNGVGVTGLDNTAILDGFAIIGGYVDKDDGASLVQGGGMYNYASSPTLANLVFSGNSTSSTGGGGGMANFYSSPILDNCIFLGNNSPYGAGMLNFGSSSPILSNCTFSGNNAITSNGMGGGMANYSSPSPTLVGCIFLNNYASSGGGMFNTNSSPRLTNCIFYGNNAIVAGTPGNGGGMYNVSSSTPNIINCTFFGNKALIGGGIYSQSSMILKNSIVWGNIPTGVGNNGGNSAALSSDVQGTGTYTGDGNINQDPIFVNAANPAGADGVFGTSDDGLKLQSPSPCINSGNIVWVYYPVIVTKDIAGLPRILGSAVDMGAYEAPFSVLPLQLLGFNANRQGKNNLVKWTTANDTVTKTFIVESSADGNGFTAIGNVGAMGIAKYSFIDINPLAARTYYRLKMIDADGMFTYSSIIWVGTNATNSASVYPNPVLHTTTLNINNNTSLIGTQAILTAGHQYSQ